jgi:HK97 family phage portal protein
MKLFGRKQKRSAVGLWLGGGDDCCPTGYTRLSDNPEVVTACRRIAELVGMLTIHIMENTESGDKRIVNELSAKLDINPNPAMTRKTFIEACAMNLLLYGDGNAVVKVNTHEGLLGSLVPVPANQVSFQPVGMEDYTVSIAGRTYDKDDVLHFRINTDQNYLWKGRGFRILLKDLAGNLAQARKTERAFLKSEYKPSLIVKVDALVDEFSSAEGRQKLIESYMKPAEPGQPWIIPAEQFQVEQIKPLSLNDLALSDSVKINKQTIASILGVPAFILGAGDYNQKEWNNFINTQLKSIVMGMQQEMTKKLILSPKWYVRFNIMSLLDWDLQTISSVFCAMGDRGYVSGNEVRDKLGMGPREGLDELKVLENYLPWDMSGKQKKLIQEGE